MPSLVFGGSHVWPMVLGAGVGLLLLVLWSARAGGDSPRWRWAAAACKLGGILLLLLCLLEPMWVRERAKPGANVMVVLADNSAGLQVTDPGSTAPRSGILRELLVGGAHSGWRERLDRDFQVRRFLFDTQLRPSTDFRELDFSGRGSGLAAALQGVAERYRGQPVAGIVLLTDGIATDWPDQGVDLTGIPPVYPVVLGGDKSPYDLALGSVSVTQSAFEDAPVVVQAEAAVAGASRLSASADLVDSKGKVIQSLPVTLSEGEPATVRFQLKPEAPGVQFYLVRLTVPVGSGAAEATLVNNQRALVVDRRKGPYRVLYVGGRPNWEFKFLNRAITEDPEVQLSAIIRIARREPKFEFRGRQGESSNPLFRGFDRTNEETERYDKPVLKRLNVRDDRELVEGFPKTAEELYNYHAVILDDVEAEFFTTDQLSLINRFVSERGGSFMMLGGQESFREGRYERTPVGDLLPVYLSGSDTTPMPDGLQLSLTREGWLQPWARLRQTEVEERQRLREVPPFLVVNRVGAIKPAASILATLEDASGKASPALVSQRFGLGKSVALMIGDFWHMGLQSEQAQRDLAKAWRQTVRWLVADVPTRLELEVKPSSGAGGGVMTMKATAKDVRYQPMEQGSVAIEVREPGVVAGSAPTNSPLAALPTSAGKPVRMVAEPTVTVPGTFAADFLPRLTGGYLAEAIATDEAGREVARAQAGWVSDPMAEEFKSIVPNRSLLEWIAKQTGGEVTTAAGLESMDLKSRKAPVVEKWSEPAWHRPFFMGLAVLLLAAEWGLRRWRGQA